MQSITEQDILTAIFEAMPGIDDRPPGAYLSQEIYEQGQKLGGKFRIGQNKLMNELRRGVEQGVLELVEVRMLNVRGHTCIKPMYLLKNSGAPPMVV